MMTIAGKAACIFALACSSILADGMEPQVLSSAGGRFVFGQLSSFRRDQYLLDTQTGRVWEIVEMPDSSRAFREVRYVFRKHSPAGPYNELTSGPVKPDTSYDLVIPPTMDSASAAKRWDLFVEWFNTKRPKK